MSRILSAQERALWARVADTIRPLAGKTLPKPPQNHPVIAPKTPLKPLQTTPTLPRNHPEKPRKTPVSPTNATLDGSWDKRLSRGLQRPDRVIDLHDHTLAQAHQLLAMAVEDARAQHHRLLLVITGKGRADRPGRIKQELSQWLEHDSLRRHIAALRPASLRHGGAGAFYLVLKRA